MFTTTEKQIILFVLVGLLAYRIYNQHLEKFVSVESFTDVKDPKGTKVKEASEFQGCYNVTNEKLLDIDDMKNVFPKLLENSANTIGLSQDKDKKLKYFVSNKYTFKKDNKATSCTDNIGSLNSEPISIGIYKPYIPATKMNLYCSNKITDIAKLKVWVNNVLVNASDMAVNDSGITITVKLNANNQNKWIPSVPMVSSIYIEYINANEDEEERKKIVETELNKIYSVACEADLYGKNYIFLLKQDIDKFFNKKDQNVAVKVNFSTFEITNDIQNKLNKKMSKKGSKRRKGKDNPKKGKKKRD
jgi:hypothetical protein